MPLLNQPITAPGYRTPAPPPNPHPALPFSTRTYGKVPAWQWSPPKGFLCKSLQLPVENLNPALAGLRILQLSDLHIRKPWAVGYDLLIDLIQTNPPDVILFTGDFLYCRPDPRVILPNLRRLIEPLKPRLGMYAVLGNHDPDTLRPYLEHLNVQLLMNRRLVLHDHSASLELIGLVGIDRRDVNDAFISGIPSPTAGVPRIVMAHFPDIFFAARRLLPTLYLAGHTHGGQICLPGGRPLLTHDRMPRSFTRGIHRMGKTWYIVSNGFGTSGLPFRLFCPAEIIEITLTSEPSPPNP